MIELLKKIETLWVSVAFAEAGEHGAVQQILAGEEQGANAEACPAV